MLDSQLELLIPEDESPGLEQLRHDLSFVAATVAQIAASLPVQRRPLSDGTKLLHARVTWLRRNGYCPCCQSVKVCDAEGKLPGAEYDHYYSRNRSGPSESWIICRTCNIRCENTDFRAASRSTFEAYQRALLLFLSDGQTELFS